MARELIAQRLAEIAGEVLSPRGAALPRGLLDDLPRVPAAAVPDPAAELFGPSDAPQLPAVGRPLTDLQADLEAGLRKALLELAPQMFPRVGTMGERIPPLSPGQVLEILLRDVFFPVLWRHLGEDVEVPDRQAASTSFCRAMKNLLLGESLIGGQGILPLGTAGPMLGVLFEAVVWAHENVGTKDLADWGEIRAVLLRNTQAFCQGVMDGVLLREDAQDSQRLGATAVTIVTRVPQAFASTGPLLSSVIIPAGYHYGLYGALASELAGIAQMLNISQRQVVELLGSVQFLLLAEDEQGLKDAREAGRLMGRDNVQALADLQAQSSDAWFLFYLYAFMGASVARAILLILDIVDIYQGALALGHGLLSLSRRALARIPPKPPLLTKVQPDADALIPEVIEHMDTALERRPALVREVKGGKAGLSPEHAAFIEEISNLKDISLLEDLVLTYARDPDAFRYQVGRLYELRRLNEKAFMGLVHYRMLAGSSFAFKAKGAPGRLWPWEHVLELPDGPRVAFLEAVHDVVPFAEPKGAAQVLADALGGFGADEVASFGVYTKWRGGWGTLHAARAIRARFPNTYFRFEVVDVQVLPTEIVRRVIDIRAYRIRDREPLGAFDANEFCVVAGKGAAGEPKILLKSSLDEKLELALEEFLEVEIKNLSAEAMPDPDDALSPAESAAAFRRLQERLAHMVFDSNLRWQVVKDFVRRILRQDGNFDGMIIMIPEDALTVRVPVPEAYRSLYGLPKEILLGDAVRAIILGEFDSSPWVELAASVLAEQRGVPTGVLMADLRLQLSEYLTRQGWDGVVVPFSNDP